MVAGHSLVVGPMSIHSACTEGSSSTTRWSILAKVTWPMEYSMTKPTR